MPATINPAPETRTRPKGIELLSATRFFVRRIPLVVGQDAVSQVELALESIGPFAPGQLYYGYCPSRDGTQALMFAAYTLLRVTTLDLVVATGSAGLLLAGRLYWVERVRTSIVVVDEVVMRELPDAASREMPKLHAGFRVVVLRESQGWWRIRLANHVEGWVPKDTVVPL